jgi:signal transduction histidine kinase/DNA-binding response OmpR family regulator
MSHKNAMTDARGGIEDGGDARRILIIDDELLIRRALSDYLSELGYDTTTAPDGAQGLEQARAASFDVVLVDLRMPKVDGLEVVATMKAEQPEVPVVVVSGTGVLSDVIEAMRRGAWDYITKPIHDMDEITVVVERVLERARLIAERDRYQQELEQLNRSLQAEVDRKTRHLRVQNRELTVLNRVIGAAATTFDSVKILRVLCAELALALDLPQTIATLIKPERDVAPVVAEYCGPDQASMLEVSFPLSQPALAQVMTSQQPLFIADVREDVRLADVRESLEQRGAVSLLLVPLLVRGRVISTVSLSDDATRTYTESDMDLVQNAAAAAAQALEAVSLHQELQQYADTLESTVEKRTEELRVALKQARAADEAKSQFLSSVSHELRTPLTSIRLYLGLLGSGPEEQKPRYLESLARETERLQTLIEGLLMLSRLDLGKTQPNFCALDLNHLLKTLATDRRRLFAERDLRLDVDLAMDLSPIVVDPKLLEQVATNLLTNAMNYTPPGGEVHLRTRQVECDGQTWATFSVEDTGPGISPEDQEHLFERFYRGTAGRNSDAPGTGLGLSISKEIVTLHEGRISLSSALGEGSTFTVWLPYDGDEAA